MNLDGVTLRGLREELRKLIGEIVRQVYQPKADLLTLSLWKGRGLTLLISPAEGRIHLTEQKYAHPPKPSAFAMLLRKHLKSGTLVEIEQPGLERVIQVIFNRDEVEYRLICELFGRGNIILVRDGEVVGSLHHGGKQRPIFPHQGYPSPPAQGKLDPLVLSRGVFGDVLRDKKDVKLWQMLLDNFDGLGPRLARELALRAELEADRLPSHLGEKERERLWGEFEHLFTQVKEGQFEPLVYYDRDRPVDVAPFPLMMYEREGLRAERQESLSQALDECYGAQRGGAGFAEQQGRLLRIVRSRLQRLQRSRVRVREDLVKAEGYDRYRLLGDLMLANLDRLERGQREAELVDPASGQVEQVFLDPRLDPAENAQIFYQRYKKLKRGVGKLRRREEELAEELSYLQELALNLEQAEDSQELSAIASELEAEGYVKPEASRPPSGPPGHREFFIEGYRVLVGRSGRRNDQLIREADRKDIWLHARGMPGAHVLIKTGGRPEAVPGQVLERAARLAAHYSQGRGSVKVPVMVTKVKYLEKRKGAKPGQVQVRQEERTLLVPPGLEED
jgi:predicted ribosome quality control (RQC) complex YloA/Tae2 family protein